MKAALSGQPVLSKIQSIFLGVHLITEPLLIFSYFIEFDFSHFYPGNFAEKRVLKLVEPFSDHCHAVVS